MRERGMMRSVPDENEFFKDNADKTRLQRILFVTLKVAQDFMGNFAYLH